jgi:hypothetical protein
MNKVELRAGQKVKMSFEAEIVHTYTTGATALRIGNCTDTACFPSAEMANMSVEVLDDLLIVGDSVSYRTLRGCLAGKGVVMAIHNKHAWVCWEEGNGLSTFTLSTLERISNG